MEPDPVAAYHHLILDDPLLDAAVRVYRFYGPLVVRFLLLRISDKPQHRRVLASHRTMVSDNAIEFPYRPQPTAVVLGYNDWLEAPPVDGVRVLDLAHDSWLPINRFLRPRYRNDFRHFLRGPGHLYTGAMTFWSDADHGTSR